MPRRRSCVRIVIGKRPVDDGDPPMAEILEIGDRVPSELLIVIADGRKRGGLVVNAGADRRDRPARDHVQEIILVIEAERISASAPRSSSSRARVVSFSGSPSLVAMISA